ncbi:MAG: transposase [Candidatus Neomarinimicrobiota bacterium]
MSSKTELDSIYMRITPMDQRRRRYDREFKIEAVNLATNSSRPFGEIANNLGLSPNMLWRWKRELAPEVDSDNGNGRIGSNGTELEKLNGELRLVKEERDALRKALIILSRMGD